MGVNAPREYTPEFCEREIGKVDIIEHRFWTLILMGIANLIATVGGLVALISAHVIPVASATVVP